MFEGSARGRIDLATAGAGARPPPPPLQGYPQSHVEWHKLVPILAERFSVVAPDLRGCGIIAHATWPLHDSLLEGINNTIKVIKRVAYGFRDDDDFFQRIRAAFLGNPG